MAQHRQIDGLIAQYCGEVETDSSGRFSLDRRAALETMSQVRLPYADAWVLKIAQAAVLAGATFLNVQQTAGDTRFEFDPRSTVAGTAFESLFFDPAHTPEPWLEALRLGLWSVGAAKRRPFELRLPGQIRGFIWNGIHLQSTSGASQETLQLNVSHRSLEEGKGLPILRTIESEWVNSAIREVIASGLYTLPLRLNLNGYRGDGFQFCPGHGFGEQDHPLRLLTVQVAGLPDVLVPFGSRENLRGPALSHPKLARLSRHFEANPQNPAQAVALLTAHCHYEYGKNGGWRVQNRKSIFCWVRHGVVIQREEFQLEPGSVSLAVFVNADQIPTDLSGFQLQESVAAPLRRAACEALTPILLRQRMETRLVDKKRHRKLLRGTTGLAIGAFLFSTIIPGAALVSAGSALATFVLAGGLGYVDGSLEDHFKRLIDGWKANFPELVE